DRVRMHGHLSRDLLQRALALRPYARPAAGQRSEGGQRDHAQLPARNAALPGGDADRLREPCGERVLVRRHRRLLWDLEHVLRQGARRVAAMTRIAFYGLGTMGLPMARNLLAVGHEVVGHDLDAARVAAVASGAESGPVEI